MYQAESEPCCLFQRNNCNLRLLRKIITYSDNILYWLTIYWFQAGDQQNLYIPTLCHKLNRMHDDTSKGIHIPKDDFMMINFVKSKLAIARTCLSQVHPTTTTMTHSFTITLCF